MQRRRDSSGLNWKPHLTLGLVVVVVLAAEPVGRSYEISVGTLSEVMPLPPGQVFMISTSSGVEVYTAATLRRNDEFRFWFTGCNSNKQCVVLNTHPEKVVPKSTPTIRRSAMGAKSLMGSLTGPLMASVDDDKP